MSCQALITPSSAAMAHTHRQDEAVSDRDGGFFMFCTGLNLESQPGSRCAEGKGLLYETHPSQ